MATQQIRLPSDVTYSSLIELAQDKNTVAVAYYGYEAYYFQKFQYGAFKSDLIFQAIPTIEGGSEGVSWTTKTLHIYSDNTAEIVTTSGQYPEQQNT